MAHQLYEGVFKMMAHQLYEGVFKMKIAQSGPPFLGRPQHSSIGLAEETKPRLAVAISPR